MVVLVAAGCGKKIPVVPVEGTVRLDGQPLADVVVTFVPDHAEGVAVPHSTGTTDASGHYQLRCEDGRDGATVGQHRVTVEDLLPYRAPRDESASRGPAPKSRVPPAYASPAETPLRAEVKQGERTIDLDLSLAGRRGRG